MTHQLDGAWGYGAIIVMALVFHEPWRWLGVALGRHVTIDGALFAWVRAVATALVGSLVVRLSLFPVGELANVPVGVRIGAFAVGMAVFFARQRQIAPGVIAGAATLVLGAWVVR